MQFTVVDTATGEAVKRGSASTQFDLPAGEYRLEIAHPSVAKTYSIAFGIVS